MREEGFAVLRMSRSQAFGYEDIQRLLQEFVASIAK